MNTITDHTEWFVGCLREIRWPTSATSRSHNQGRVRDEELDDPDGRTPQRIAVLEQDTGAQVCHGRHYHFIAESKTVIEKPLSSSDSSKVHRFVICETPQGSTADLEQLDEKMESFIARVAQVLIVQKVLKFTVFRQDSSMNAALRPFNASPPKHTFLFQMDFPNQEDLTEVQSDATFAEIRDETMVLFDSTVFTADISTISLRRKYD
ncbi:hypothetical protein FB45DRAFT_45112 [Roridomyces roridus]|uniref:Uncharacterized protein n=1 Tax=Roridomyces roridus TaxID=1738132 RepID=A0AAD7BS16_9AGAR|nr:hypothetical protein FB45DRAFT_45112 [Roridomyces roridus]